MDYCRSGEDSDVCLVLNDPKLERFECCGCLRSPQKLTVIYGREAALDHLRDHRLLNKHKVPECVIERLAKEIAEGTTYMTPEEVWQSYADAYGHDSVEAFQKFFGLMETGLLDPATFAPISHRRCGLRDNLVIISEAKWRKRELSWFWKNYLPGLTTAQQDECTEESWRVWSEVCDLKFRKADSIARADIVYDVGRGRQHGFDGPGGVLAWMQLGTNNDNPIGGMFDLDEAWRLTRQQPGWLLPVEAHENGHALNFSHAPQNSGALMAPYVNWQVWKPQRHDVSVAQSLYGPPRPTEPPPAGEQAWLNKAAKEVMGRALTDLELANLLALAPDRMKQMLALLTMLDRHKYLATGWYRAFLKREPDAGGLANFVGALQAGLSHDHCIAVFLSSPEYRGAAATSDNLDPKDPNPTNGGLMNLFRDILVQVVTAVLAPFRKVPFLGRFITDATINRIVDAILRGLGPQAQTIEASLQAGLAFSSAAANKGAALTQPADVKALITEVEKAVGEVPTS